jgi:hypothetical protein
VRCEGGIDVTNKSSHGGAGNSDSRNSTTVAAHKYFRRGWPPVPLQPKSKKPIHTDWPNRRLKPDELDREFAGDRNIGLLLGDRLADIDLDCAEARWLGARYLPPTGAIFGRSSTPRAHYLYECEPAGFRTAQFEDPSSAKDDRMILEVRGSGSQTMVPPSRHPEGETVEWEFEGGAAEISYEKLLACVKQIAAGSLLARHWRNGARHSAALPLAGALVRAGWLDVIIEEFVFEVARAAHDEEANDRRADVRSTISKFKAGSPVTGIPTCVEIFGEAVWAKVSEWLTLSTQAQIKEPPQALYRDVPPGKEFSVDALGEIGAAAARKIHEMTRAPLAICSQSVLAAMNLAVAGHRNVRLLTGEEKPTAEFFASIASTGERKTTADNLAIEEFKNFEDERDDSYRKEKFDWDDAMAAWQKTRDDLLKVNKTRETRATALKLLGPPPDPPIASMMLAAADSSPEGLTRMAHEGGVSVIGLFTDEGGSFIGGYAMGKDTKLHTAAALSKWWDGESPRRTRAGDGFYAVKGRRLSVNILIQPDAAQEIFADRVLGGQGLLTRILAVMPESAAGTREFVEVSDFTALTHFNKRVRELLQKELSYRNPARHRDGLKPAAMRLSEEAQQLWREFYRQVEEALGPGKRLHEIMGLANKIAEHAIRLAGTIAFFNTDSDIINAEYMQKGIMLARHYLDEALRIRLAATLDSELLLARNVLSWLQDSWQEPQGLVSLPDIYQRCPHQGVRTKATAAPIVKKLEEHGWLERAPSAPVNGTPRRDVWHIIKE